MSLKAYLKSHPKLAHTIYSLRPFSWKPSSVNLSDVLNNFAAKVQNVYFLQIGSNDGVNGDTIHDLVRQKGWRGIAVEPLPEIYKRLRDNYAGQPGVEFENSAISATSGTLDFYTLRETATNNSSQVSSFVYDVIAKQKPLMPDFDERFEVRKVAAITVAELLAKYSVRKLDLLHIDAEGYDFEILKMFDFQKITPQLIIYESEHLSRADYKLSLALLKANGYRVFFRDGHDTIALRDTKLL
jgi:FkbM family methyltransferase